MPFHWFYIVGLLLIVLIIFGPGRLPELGGAVGKAMREFRKATSELTNEVTQTVQAPNPPSPAPPAQPVETTPVKGPESASSSNS
jgi:sec-independent protein translocase protein TatA